MKHLRLVILITLSLDLLYYSCGNSSNSSNSDANKNATTEEAIASDTKVQTDNAEAQVSTVEEEGDPNIVAASVDTMEMVVDNHDNLVGRYVKTEKGTYFFEVQDMGEVPRLGHKIVVYRARDSQGIVFTYRKNVNIRQRPSLESPVITQISHEEGGVPETYPCLGKTKGWYKVNVKGKIGYVRHDLVIWDGMDTF